MIHRADLLALSYRAFDRPWKFEKHRLALDRLDTIPLVRGRDGLADGRLGRAGGKSRGVTRSQALASGLVLVINPVAGQKERNCHHFLEEDVAIGWNNLTALEIVWIVVERRGKGSSKECLRPFLQEG